MFYAIDELLDFLGYNEDPAYQTGQAGVSSTDMEDYSDE